MDSKNHNQNDWYVTTLKVYNNAKNYLDTNQNLFRLSKIFQYPYIYSQSNYFGEIKIRVVYYTFTTIEMYNDNK